MSARLRHPLFVVCQNPKCQRVTQVETRYQQRTRTYCSRRCIGAMRRFTQDERRRGGRVSGVRRHQAALKRFVGMSPLEIFRQAYSIGWKAGARSARRRMVGRAA